MHQQQTKSDFDWRDFNWSDWTILAVLVAVVAVIIYAIVAVVYMGYGKQLLQMAHQVREHAQYHYIAEKIGEGGNYIYEHAPKLLKYIREHPLRFGGSGCAIAVGWAAARKAAGSPRSGAGAT